MQAFACVPKAAKSNQGGIETDLLNAMQHCRELGARLYVAMVGGGPLYEAASREIGDERLQVGGNMEEYWQALNIHRDIRTVFYEMLSMIEKYVLVNSGALKAIIGSKEGLDLKNINIEDIILNCVTDVTSSIKSRLDKLHDKEQ